MEAARRVGSSIIPPIKPHHEEEGGCVGNEWEDTIYTQ